MMESEATRDWPPECKPRVVQLAIGISIKRFERCERSLRAARLGGFEDGKDARPCNF